MRRLSLLACAAAALLPPAALAHSGAAHGWWNTDPWVWVPWCALSLAYLRGIAVLRARGVRAPAARAPAMVAFAGGVAALFLALIWPLDALAQTSFAAHMAQHMFLIAVAAPLFVLARPMPVLLAAIPAPVRRVNAAAGPLHALLQVLTRPGIAFGIHGVLIWIWHAPLLFELALRWRWLHMLEHAAFLGSALLFWSAMRHAARSRTEGSAGGTAVLLTLATLMHTGLLGALLTFSPRLLYRTGAAPEGLSPLEDQQLAGLLMWIPGSVAYLIAGLVFVAVWLRGSVPRATR